MSLDFPPTWCYTLPQIVKFVNQQMFNHFAKQSKQSKKPDYKSG